MQYKEATSKMGFIRLSEEKTSILDCSEYAWEGTVYPVKMENLEDEADYTAYGFNKLSDGTYYFVIITDGTSGSVTYKTEFVIFSEYRANGSSEEIVVYEPGKGEAVYKLDDSSVAIPSIYRGTPVVLKKNILRNVTQIVPLFNFNFSSGYKSFAQAVREGIYKGDLSAVLNVNNLDM